MSEERRLDLAPLQSSLSQLDRALNEYAQEPDRRANRDSVALHYMIVWNLLFPAITRYLELQSVKRFEGVEASFEKVIRRADALELIKTGWPGFGKFRDARNAIAHMYDQPHAQLIVEAAPAFADEAHFVLDKLKERLDDATS